jgi:hypothetical protein
MLSLPRRFADCLRRRLRELDEFLALFAAACGRSQGRSERDGLGRWDMPGGCHWPHFLEREGFARSIDGL